MAIHPFFPLCWRQILSINRFPILWIRTFHWFNDRNNAWWAMLHGDISHLMVIFHLDLTDAISGPTIAWNMVHLVSCWPLSKVCPFANYKMAWSTHRYPVIMHAVPWWSFVSKKLTTKGRLLNKVASIPPHFYEETGVFIEATSIDRSFPYLVISVNSSRNAGFIKYQYTKKQPDKMTISYSANVHKNINN